MVLWFVGTACAAVWFVFRDDRFDYRVLVLGALRPDVVDLAWGGARMLHSVTASTVVLAAVMFATTRGTDTRRRWLALPIGMFLHLIFDGAFANPVTFWWPVSGVSFSDAPLPSIERGLVNVPLEIVGLFLIGWLARSHGIVGRREVLDFARTGRLVHRPDPRVGRC
jgi:hypothetical protein